MIDERTRQMIEWYLPNPPDPELEEGEYYYRQSTMKGEQVIKVRVTAIFPGEMHQPEEYEIYQIRSDGLRHSAASVTFDLHITSRHRRSMSA